MPKALTFKGDKKKKRKVKTEPYPTEGNSTTVARVDVDEEDGWVNADTVDDISGPVIFVFASTPPACLSCDATGKTFASEIENIEGEDLTTVEPHDVRQVWVPTRIGGSHRFAFKGHHNRYLTCDKIGTLSASKEAVSPEEEFTPIKNDTGWSLQTIREKFVSAEEIEGKGVEVRGDAETIAFGETWCIRIQRRFKKKVKKEGEVVREKITRKDLEKQAGQELDDEQYRKLKKAKREGTFASALLDIRQKGKHDKWASGY